MIRHDVLDVSVNHAIPGPIEGLAGLDSPIEQPTPRRLRLGLAVGRLAVPGNVPPSDWLMIRPSFPDGSGVQSVVEEQNARHPILGFRRTPSSPAHESGQAVRWRPAVGPLALTSSPGVCLGWPSPESATSSPSADANKWVVVGRSDRASAGHFPSPFDRPELRSLCAHPSGAVAEIGLRRLTHDTLLDHGPIAPSHHRNLATALRYAIDSRGRPRNTAQRRPPFGIPRWFMR